MANAQRVNLVENASATGSAKLYKGGPSTFSATATFGGGTVKLQVLLPDGSTWVDVAGGSLTAAGMTAVLWLPQGQYRANIATATAVYAYLNSAH
jgi:hypothetical protein